MIKRIQEATFISKLKSNKILILSGAKGVGKSLFLHQIFEQEKQTPLIINCADKREQKSISGLDFQELKNAFGVRPYVVLQEAQHLENLQEIIGHILSDELKNTFILSCSYEPTIDPFLWEALKLQGLEFVLHPYGFSELAQHFGLPNEEKQLEQRLIYGQYPFVVTPEEHPTINWENLIQQLLHKQLGHQDRINKTEKLLRLLQYLSFKIGQAISFNEIGKEVGIDNETAERYVLLFEKANILFKLPVFHSEKRYELKKTHIIYFYDCGLRNALIQNFNPLSLRLDQPELWKNWLFSERIKWLQANGIQKELFFWKTHTAQEMDFIEKDETGIKAFKTQWDKQKKCKIPSSFQQYYPNITTSIINRNSYWTFLTKK